MHADLDPLSAESPAASADQTGRVAELARVQTLLEQGPLAEAEELCNQALDQFSQSQDLLALKAGIERKEAAIRDMLEKGESYLKERDFRSASDLFTEASRLLPLDRELAEHIVAILHKHAQAVLETDWQAAQASVDLAGRIQPESVVSPFVADSLEKKQEESEKSKNRASTSKAKWAAVIVGAWIVILALGLLVWNAYTSQRFGRSKHPLDITNFSKVEVAAPRLPVTVTSVSVPVGTEIPKPVAPKVSAPEPAAPNGPAAPPLPSTPDLKPEKTNPPAAADLLPDAKTIRERTESGDWDAVDRNSKTELSAFIAKYPAGSYADEASTLIADLDRRAREEAQRLADLRSAELKQVETAAILAQIHRFSSAWNTKDIDSILAIQSDLSRQSLRAQFSSVKNVAMTISPLSAPQIAGTEATLVCRRQADETYSDGSVRHNPEAVVTYSLSKRNGSWVIDSAR